MKTLANHPGYQLRDDAADSWNRFERDHGVRQVTSAYRSPAEQQALINRWNSGGKYNRPPYLYEPAPVSGPNASRHLTGIAIDTPNAQALSAQSNSYGFRFLFAYDVVHLEYDPAYDQHKPGSANASLNTGTLRRGSKGAAVGALQRKLKSNYPLYAAKLVVDEDYGPATEAAIKEFQRRSGLTPDGIAGPLTRAKLGV